MDEDGEPYPEKKEMDKGDDSNGKDGIACSDKETVGDEVVVRV